ncbi:MAG TPA: hypothetical protein DCR66_00965 [Pseudomonas sp.]|nr:hypothetical protein [Pseudomonas sp.]
MRYAIQTIGWHMKSPLPSRERARERGKSVPQVTPFTLSPGPSPIKGEGRAMSDTRVSSITVPTGVFCGRLSGRALFHRCGGCMAISLVDDAGRTRRPVICSPHEQPDPNRQA